MLDANETKNIEKQLNTLKKYVDDILLDINKRISEVSTLNIEKDDEEYFEEKNEILKLYEKLKTINIYTPNGIINNVWKISLDQNLIHITCIINQNLFSKNIQPSNEKSNFYVTSLPIYYIEKIDFPTGYSNEKCEKVLENTNKILENNFTKKPEKITLTLPEHLLKKNLIIKGLRVRNENLEEKSVKNDYKMFSGSIYGYDIKTNSYRIINIPKLILGETKDAWFKIRFKIVKDGKKLAIDGDRFSAGVCYVLYYRISDGKIYNADYPIKLLPKLKKMNTMDMIKEIQKRGNTRNSFFGPTADPRDFIILTTIYRDTSDNKITLINSLHNTSRLASKHIHIQEEKENNKMNNFYKKIISIKRGD